MAASSSLTSARSAGASNTRSARARRGATVGPTPRNLDRVAMTCGPARAVTVALRVTLHRAEQRVGAALFEHPRLACVRPEDLRRPAKRALARGAAVARRLVELVLVGVGVFERVGRCDLLLLVDTNHAGGRPDHALSTLARSSTTGVASSAGAVGAERAAGALGDARDLPLPAPERPAERAPVG